MYWYVYHRIMACFGMYCGMYRGMYQVCIVICNMVCSGMYQHILVHIGMYEHVLAPIPEEAQAEVLERLAQDHQGRPR